MRVPKASLAALLAMLCVLLLAPAAAQASFGIAGLKVSSLEQNGTLDLRAGSHPDALKVSLAMNLDGKEIPEGTLSQVIVDLPAGMVGNPLAVPRCPAALFEGQQPRCPGESQVGVVRLKAVGFPTDPTGPVYNLTPPLGVAASIGFSVIGFNSFQEASLRTGADYGVRVSDITVPTKIQIKSLTETIWGVPAAANHDGERVCVPNEGVFIHGCESEADPAAFLTLPTSCGAPLLTTVTAGSVQEPLNPRSASFESEGEEGEPQGLHGCDALPFAPSISAQPETTIAESPTGLDVDVHVPQSKGPGGIATAHLKQTTFALPAGMSLNPSAAAGLEACSPAQIDLHGAGPAACPASSELGSVQVKTPLLDHPLPGKVYLASQIANPFGSLLAIYIVVEDPLTGVIVKLAGKVEPDPVTGQLITTVTESPQVPFEDFELNFTGGPRGALTTPPTCGAYTATAALTPWSAPESPTANVTDSFTVSSAPGGGPCAPSEASLPNSPGFEAGTTTPLAGVYSPFVMKLTRSPGSQRLSAFQLTLPPGVSARFAGREECSEAQIAAAMTRSHPDQGALELTSPSCPAGSELGTVTVGAGSGAPFYVQGRAYLAGPYKNAPYSVVAITPAVAGPFDLGSVVVRSALYVDETTAQGTIVTDPLPTILQGIPLDIRSIAIRVDAGQFTLNPTSCEAKAVSGWAVSTTGAAAPLSNRFQVGGCGGLGFAPKVSVSLKGGTHRASHPKLRATLSFPQGSYANLRDFTMILPRSEFIDPERVGQPCTRPAFAEGRCPKASVLGKATAYSPLLDQPLSGKVYFRANGGARELPDIVLDLNGAVHIVSVAYVDAVVRKGTEISRIRSRTLNVPDAPISRVVLELKGGSEGVLQNSENLCAKKRTATIRMSAQNGKSDNFAAPIATSCPKRKARLELKPRPHTHRSIHR